MAPSPPAPVVAEECSETGGAAACVVEEEAAAARGGGEAISLHRLTGAASGASAWDTTPLQVHIKRVTLSMSSGLNVTSLLVFLPIRITSKGRRESEEERICFFPV